MRHQVREPRTKSNQESVVIRHVIISVVGPIMCYPKVLTSIWAVCVSTRFNCQQQQTTSVLVRQQYARSRIVMEIMMIIMTVLTIVAQNKVRPHPTPPIRRRESTVIAATVNSLGMEL